MIVVVDYGMGNLGSIRNMLKRLDVPAEVASDRARIEAADKLILPGVGAFDEGMSNLESREQVEVITKKVMEDRVPVLGICLGMQLMTRGSEEGRKPGLGWVQAETVHLRRDAPPGAERLKYPHIGWSYVDWVREHPLTREVPPDSRFYFVHSFKVVCDRREDVLADAAHGPIVYCAAFARDNMVGVQFHPEKSHRFGLRLLSAFAKWPGAADPLTGASA
ncbi:MAG: imidazole glycerol phosphate synthase subunit HisH [Deltaproteobacteria bacterium]|nr:imidazole glycerol phosphate synthase subunit HisH [Deltaproteobacteria bacterium]